MATTPVPEQMTMHSISELLGGIRDRQGRANPLQIDMEMLGGVGLFLQTLIGRHSRGRDRLIERWRSEAVPNRSAIRADSRSSR